MIMQFILMYLARTMCEWNCPPGRYPATSEYYSWINWTALTKQSDVFSSILFWPSKMSLKFCVTQLHSIIKPGCLLNTQNVSTSSYYINEFNETVENSFDITAVTYTVRRHLNIWQVVPQRYTVSWHQTSCSWKISKNAVSQTVSTPSMSEKS